MQRTTEQMGLRPHITTTKRRSERGEALRTQTARRERDAERVDESAVQRVRRMKIIVREGGMQRTTKQIGLRPHITLCDPEFL